MTTVTYGNARLALALFDDWIKDVFSKRFERSYTQYSAASFERVGILEELGFVTEQLARLQARPESWFLEVTRAPKETVILDHQQYLESLHIRHETSYSEECSLKLSCDVYNEIMKCRLIAWKLYTALVDEERETLLKEQSRDNGIHNKDDTSPNM